MPRGNNTSADEAPTIESAQREIPQELQPETEADTSQGKDVPQLLRESSDEPPFLFKPVFPKPSPHIAVLDTRRPQPSIADDGTQLSMQMDSLACEDDTRLLWLFPLGSVTINLQNVILARLHSVPGGDPNPTTHRIRGEQLISYVQADLSPDLLLLGTYKPTVDTSMVHGICLTSKNRGRQWYSQMPPGEHIDAVACGEGWAAVATDLNFLCLYTSAGIQMGVTSLPGPIVTMCGRENTLFVVITAGPRHSTGTQTLAYNAIEMAHVHAIPEDYRILPLSARSSLRWVGISNRMSLCFEDTNNFLHMASGSGEVT